MSLSKQRRGGRRVLGGAHYHPERRRLRSSGCPGSGATISEENQERKEEMEKGAPGGEAGAGDPQGGRGGGEEG